MSVVVSTSSNNANDPSFSMISNNSSGNSSGNPNTGVEENVHQDFPFQRAGEDTTSHSQSFNVVGNDAHHHHSHLHVTKQSYMSKSDNTDSLFLRKEEPGSRNRVPLERDVQNDMHRMRARRHSNSVNGRASQAATQSSSSGHYLSPAMNGMNGKGDSRDENLRRLPISRSQPQLTKYQIDSVHSDSKRVDTVASDDYKIEIKQDDTCGVMRAKPHAHTIEQAATQVAEEKNRILQEQATRRAAINREQQNILMNMEKEDAFWKKQEDRFKLMVKRQNLARKTSEELQHFINKWNKMMMGTAQGYRNLTQYGREETGTLRTACISQGILSKSLADHYSEMRERIFTDAGREAADLSKNMFANTKMLEASGKKLSKVIKTARSKCMDSWVSYAKAVQERQRLEIAGKAVSRDPFVACRLYDRDVAALRKQEMQYRKEMTRLFRDFKVEDGRRIDKTQSIVLDYLLAQKAMFEDGIKFTESAIEAVKSIDREADVNEFIRQADLLVAPADQKGKRAASLHADTVFEVQPPHRDPKTLSRLYAQECQCQGALYRQGKFLKSSWKKSHIVLSRSGFFHQFESKNAVQPEISICLRDCQVNLAPKEDPCAFEIVEPSRGFFSVVGGPTRHCYKAESEEELVDW
eukprot:CAMPEP_0114499978 /NCGR_PEP_ID=MMETSP0109-20121206/7711_1 /TAXON_ID=29199 /ORGANISM="Chlorarachnion reptans, Strain CCCM449" /LENGTH=637 /DNA_ID=CAMNT_0001677593 /DNA_START=345 /DNA_END=2255 /DNA_ORIENTATION=-